MRRAEAGFLKYARGLYGAFATQPLDDRPLVQKGGPHQGQKKPPGRESGGGEGAPWFWLTI